MPAETKTVEGPTSQSLSIALARLGPVSGSQSSVNDSDWIDVHFNPASLQLQITNQLKDADRNHPAQYIAKSTIKLSMELQFDTTNTGENVIQTTRKLQCLMVPPPGNNSSDQKQPPPPVVLFEWGAFTFKGIIDTYTETTDYFSAGGVPLRSLVKLTLSKQDAVFEPAGSANGPAPDPNVDVPARSPAQAAKDGNNPSAARGIAAANGEESLRFSAGASLTVGAGITLKPPSGFASVGVSAGAGLSLGINASADVGGGSGLSGLARLSATEGAFAGLRTNVSISTPGVDPSRLLPASGSGSLATGAGADFQLGGRASVQGAAGLRADVGASASFNSKLSFD